MTIEKIAKSRIEDLIRSATSLRRGDQYNQCSSLEQRQQCIGWLTSALNVVQRIIPDGNSAYREAAEEIVARESAGAVCQSVGALSEVLGNLLDDMDEGLLISITDQARAEVFDDFLDHAKSYLANSRKNESGVIAGVVFEDSLRRVCKKTGIEEKGVKLDQLITSLASSDVLSANKAKRARVAADVRTKATHAQWDEFDAADVRATIEFTEEFVSTHLDR